MHAVAATAYVNPRLVRTVPGAANDAGPSLVPTDRQALRETVARLERSGAAGARPGVETVVPLGLPEIDRLLAHGGLLCGALHEVETEPGERPESAAHDGVATGFAARALGGFSTAARRRGGAGDLLWVRAASGHFDAPPYAPGLTPFLDPARLLLVTVRRDEDLLWAMEEALRTPSLAAVLGETCGADLTATRRLQLAAERSGVPALLLRPTGGRGRQRTTASAATTRWRIAPAESVSTPELRDVGAARWRLELRRNRHGAPLGDPFPSWLVETNDETGDLSVVSAIVDRPAVAALPGFDDARLAV